MMSTSTYVIHPKSIQELVWGLLNSPQHFSLGFLDYSLSGTMTLLEWDHWLSSMDLHVVSASRHPLTWVWELDLLYQERDFGAALQLIYKLIKDQEKLSQALQRPMEFFFHVQDWGLIQWLGQYLNENNKNAHFRLSVALESGLHNQAALTELVTQLGSRIGRVVFSKELPLSVLEQHLTQLPVAVQGQSHLLISNLLFYSPRFLLSENEKLKQLWPSDHQTLSPDFRVRLDSEESAHRGFLGRETKAGFFLYHPKLLTTLGSYQQRRGLSCLWSIDLRLHPQIPLDQLWEQLSRATSDQQEHWVLKWIQDNCGQGHLQGYAQQNKSTVLFKKLKNSNLQQWRRQTLGQVVDVSERRMLIKCSQPLAAVAQRSALGLVSPQGKYWEWNWPQKDCCEELAPGYIWMPKKKGVVPGTLLVCLNEEVVVEKKSPPGLESKVSSRL